MSDSPNLPDTDNPFELLGLEEDADERAIKRAYVKAIKIFRPERRPEEFQRLNQAYRDLTEGRAWMRRMDRLPAEREEPRESEAESEIGLRLEKTAPAEVFQAEEWSEAEPTGDDDESEPEPESEPYPDAEAYWRIEQLIDAGEMDAAQRELESRPTGIDDTFDELRLRLAIARLFTDLAAAERLYAPISGGAVDASEDLYQALYQDLHDEREALAEWQAPRELREVIGTLLVSESGLPEERRLVIDRVHGREHRRAFGGLAEHEHLFFIIADALGWAYRLWDDDEELCDLDPLVESKLDDEIERIDEELRENPSNKAGTFAIGVAGMLQIYFFFTLGWWSLATLGGALVFLFVVVFFQDRKLYAEIVQPWLLSVLECYEVDVDAVVARAKAVGKSTDDIGRFRDEMREDLAARVYPDFLEAAVRR
jgi:hypothetical protein